MTWAKMTEEFAAKNGHPAPAAPTGDPDPKVTILRLRLMMEELGELACAIHAKDLTKIADGICDLLYVTVGTAVAHGLGPLLEELFAEVHRSNMTKFSSVSCHFDMGVKYQRETGKLDTYDPPRIAEMIANYQQRLNLLGTPAGSFCCLPFGPLSGILCKLPAGHSGRKHENREAGVTWVE